MTILGAANGLRDLIGGMRPLMQGVKQGVAGLPTGQKAMLGGMAALGGASAAGAFDSAPAAPKTPADAQLSRWYDNVETHRPHDAHEAYNEDQFMREAFAASGDYDTYAKILGSAGVSPNAWMTPEEYTAVASDPKMAQEYVSQSARATMADFNGKSWGADWEKELYDPNVEGHSKQWREYQAKQAAKYAKAMRSGKGGSEI